VLRATRRLLRPGGSTGFYTILPATGLSAADYARAIRCGPRAVSTRRRSHEGVLRSAGFVEIQSLDVTSEWRTAVAGFLAQQDRLAEALIAALGRQDWQERQRSLRRTLQAIDEHLLERRLFTARTPEEAEP
jgi:hypothetical protein